MVDDSDQTLVPKLTAMAVLGLASLTLGLGPLKLAVWLDWEQPSRRKSSNEPAEALHNHGGKGGSRLLSALLCFGGGVLMCTTFLHMLPEVQEAFTELGHDNVISESMAATAPHLLMCIGFFIMYLVEELVHLYLHRRAHKHGHGHGDGRDDNLNNLKVQNNLALIDDEESVMTSPIKSLQWSAKDSKPSSVILEYADGSQVKSEVPVEFLVAGVTFTSPWGIGALDKQYVRVDAERPRCQFTPRLSTCHKVHHDHNLEPELGNLPGFMAGANHHSHAIPVSGPAADGGAGATGLDEDPVVSALRGLLIVLALSVHELFEGLAVGLEAVAGNVWYMLAAVACHKLVIAFCIGVELVSMHTKVLLHVLYVTTFAVVSPLGIGVGILVTSKYGDIEGGVLPSVLQGLATGTLLYVVFFEILERQRACGHSGLQQYLAVLTGFLVMYAMSFIGGEHHHHHHHHDGGEEVNSTFAVLHA